MHEFEVPCIFISVYLSIISIYLPTYLSIIYLSIYSIYVSFHLRTDIFQLFISGASHVTTVVKNPPANPGDVRDTGSIPGLGRSPGGGHGNPL